jgi:hypothetical protein
MDLFISQDYFFCDDGIKNDTTQRNYENVLLQKIRTVVFYRYEFHHGVNWSYRKEQRNNENYIRRKKQSAYGS